jgi:hypothetical protein
MKRAIGFLGMAALCLLAFGFFLACSDSDDGGNVPSELQGTWTSGGVGLKFTDSQLIMIVSGDLVPNSNCNVDVTTSDGTSGAIEITSSPEGVYNGSKADYEITNEGTRLRFSNAEGSFFMGFSYLTLTKQD